MNLPLIIVSLLFSLCSFSQNNARENSRSLSDLVCQDFKTGTFYSIIPGNAYTIRTKKISKSYQYFSGKEYESIWKIKWTSGCEFHLIFKKSNNPNNEFKKGDVIFVTIKPIDPTTYLYDSKLVNKEYPKGKEYSTGSSSTEKIVKKRN